MKRSIARHWWLGVVVLAIAAAGFAGTKVRANPKSVEVAVPAPGPAPYGRRVHTEYGSTTFTSQSDCQSYLPGGANENSSWPQGVIDAAEAACCDGRKNRREFVSSQSKGKLECHASDWTVECNGAECDEPAN